MSKLVEQLLLVLNKEQEIYDEIILMSRDKQNAIVANNIKTLEGIVHKEKTYAISLAKLEEIRSKIIDQLVKEYDLVEVSALSDLYPHMSRSEYSKVDSIKTKLLNTVKVLNEKNDLNKKLIAQSLEQIEFDFNLLTMVGDGNVNYAGDADDMDVERKSIFDKKI